jgi:hypothetical protein
MSGAISSRSDASGAGWRRGALDGTTVTGHRAVFRLRPDTDPGAETEPAGAPRTSSSAKRERSTSASAGGRVVTTIVTPTPPVPTDARNWRSRCSPASIRPVQTPLVEFDSGSPPIDMTATRSASRSTASRTANSTARRQSAEVSVPSTISVRWGLRHPLICPSSSHLHGAPGAGGRPGTFGSQQSGHCRGAWDAREDLR